MTDLIPDVGSLLVTNEQRHAAAQSIAEMQPDRSRVAYLLVALDLATHDDDGLFRSTPDKAGDSWFTPAPRRRRGTLRARQSQLRP